MIRASLARHATPGTEPVTWGVKFAPKMLFVLVALAASSTAGCASLLGVTPSESAAPAEPEPLQVMPEPAQRDPEIEELFRRGVQSYWAADATDDALYVRLMASSWVNRGDDTWDGQILPFMVVTKLRSDGACMLHQFAAIRDQDNVRAVESASGGWDMEPVWGAPRLLGEAHEYLGPTSCDEPGTTPADAAE